MTVECDRVFLSIGQSIVWGDLITGMSVELDKNLRPKADSITYQTAQPDVFVGGDVYTGPKFAIDAIAAGKEGALSIHRFVRPNTSLTIGRKYARQFAQFDKDILVMPEYDKAPRQTATINKKLSDKLSFRDSKNIFTEEQVKAETARCLGCGATIVDQNRCIGCGICTTKCEFDAIHIYRERPECSTMAKAEDVTKHILPYMVKRKFRIKKNKRRVLKEQLKEQRGRDK